MSLLHHAHARIVGIGALGARLSGSVPNVIV